MDEHPVFVRALPASSQFHLPKVFSMVCFFRDSGVPSRRSREGVSPDGTLVAFSGYTGGRADIYVMNTDGTKLTSSNAGEYQVIPVSSPDGRLIRPQERTMCRRRGRAG